MSLKFQITVPEALMAVWKHEADSAGLSVAELIRQTMADRLSGKRSLTNDPFESITGLINTDERDLAARVDEVLYG